jgi:hypothetical protein
MIAQVGRHARWRRSLTITCVVVLVAACGKSGPPPDLIKNQRETYNRAKAVSSVIEQSDQDSRKQIDQASQ